MAASYAGCWRMSVLDSFGWKYRDLLLAAAFDGGLCNILDQFIIQDAIYCFKSGICNFLSNQMLPV